ncbi:hypothetical protein GLOTRDRAFT_112528 [Gloeophyllum trabeum ATCC 11539]|uniref:Uncharacterized protein n=1 Tax=Gloeophyllum trabeum (strain ATCC 11539 / FP-39264 / Madison 617) TaxID=670483 RepID=S7R9V1_GLOTA|nr:uncharacterized protein GLOTRDRAFT_112528 [Gloeophyllum trabeum ATCC 11539]EPQ51015.1 hypothetical protein GLOTRDRAFT_112528 [Gloeophyllum trabeum ATCC 11539]
MAVMDSNGDQEMLRLWGLISELSDQLAQNRDTAMQLHAQLGNVKTQAVNSQTGFVLRRFNMDKSKEAYEAELERMNAAMAADNQALAYDNKQLNSLIKEYEQTLDSVMSTFRNRANEVQEHELALIKEYEAQLIARETEDLERELAASTAFSEALSRISNLLRLVTRQMNGEDPALMPPDYERDRITGGELHHPTLDGEPDEEPASLEQAVADWALDRETELARLEKENEELRRLAGLLPDAPVRPAMHDSEGSNFLSSFPRLQKNMLGGAPGTVGPYGTYKKPRTPGAG